MRPLDRYAFDCRGWVRFDGVLDPKAVSKLREAIAARRLPPPGPSVGQQRFGQDGDLFRWHPRFLGLLDHPVVLDALAALVGPTARLDHSYGIMMRPGTSGLGLHGPAQPFDPAQFYAHRGGRMWNGLVAFSWALTDARAGEGGFGCIPGSHRAEEPLPTGAEALVAEVAQPAGSLLIFTEALFHCTLPWRGAEDRDCLLFKYCPGSMAYAHLPAVPADVLPGLTDRQRALAQPPSVAGHPPLPGAR